VTDFYFFKSRCQENHKSHKIPIQKHKPSTSNAPDIQILDSDTEEETPQKTPLESETIDMLLDLNHKILNLVKTLENKVDDLRRTCSAIEEENEREDNDGDDSDSPVLIEDEERIFFPSTSQSDGGSMLLRPPKFPENILSKTVEEVIAFDYLLHDEESNQRYFEELLKRKIYHKNDFKNFLRGGLDMIMSRDVQVQFSFSNLCSLNSINILSRVTESLFPTISRENMDKYLKKHFFNKKSYLNTRKLQQQSMKSYHNSRMFN
jgi:hypothetical protein